MMIKNRKILRNLVLMGILSSLGCFALLLGAPQQKKVISTVKRSPAIAVKVLPLKVYGQVLKQKKGVKNVIIKLVPIHQSREFKSLPSVPTQDKTDNNGRYSFTIDAKMRGQKYKLVPMYPNFPPGKYFFPSQKEFILRQNLRINFIFKPPTLRTIPTKSKSKTKPQIGKKKSQVALAKRITVLSPGGGKYVTGQHLSIRWKTNWKIGPDDFFLIELYSGSGKKFKRIIGTNKEGWSKPYPNSYPWNISGDIWPEFYTIRISYRKSGKMVSSVTQEMPRGLSARFHIARSYTKAKVSTILSKIHNRVMLSAKDGVRNVDCEREERNRMKGERRPGAGTILVGYSGFGTYHKGKNDRGEWVYGFCYGYYRSHVYFNLKSVPKDSIVEEAKLKYTKSTKSTGGCQSSATFYVIKEKWNENSNLWSIKTSSRVDPKDFRAVVNKWLAFPKSNYGLLFSGPGKGHGKSGCLLYYYSVRLVLKIRKRVK